MGRKLAGLLGKFAVIICLSLAVPAVAHASEDGAEKTKSVTQLSVGAPASSTKYPTPIAAGSYVIVRTGASTQALDAAAGGTKNGTNVQLYQANNTPAQTWRVSYDKDGLYTLVNEKSGRALDVTAAKARNGANVQLYTSNKTLAQKWILVATDTGIALQSAINHAFVLDCAAGGKRNGTNIQLYRSNGSIAQRFNFYNVAPTVKAEKTVEDGVYTLNSAAAASKVVDVAAGSANNGANVQLYQANHSTAQRWRVVCGKDGFYTITSIESGLALDVAAALKVPGTNVWQYKSNGTDAQKWAIGKNADGTYTLVSKCNGLALSIAGGNTANGTNVQMARKGTSKAVKFALDRVPVLADGVYMLYPKLAQTSQAVDVIDTSAAEGAAMQVFNVNGCPAQRFVITGLGDDVYSIHAVASGKYLADVDGKVVQKHKADGALTDNQKWEIVPRGGGIMAVNVATGKVMALAGGKATAHARVVTRAEAGNASERFRPVRYDNLLQRGLYSLQNLSASTVLDVAGGSWSSGANAQLYKANGSNAQKFAIVPLGGNTYRIIAAIAGTSLNATGNAGGTSNVNFASPTGSAAQVWTIKLTDGGLVFINKGTGKVLGTAGGAAGGANVVNAPDGQIAAAGWRAYTTSVNMSELTTIHKLVKQAPTTKNPKFDANGRSFNISKSAYDQLVRALSKAWNRGEAVGFLMTDLTTGMTLASNADKVIYGASTLKAIYVTYIFQELLEKNKVKYSSIKSQLDQTIIHSNNSTYVGLRNRFGNSGFSKWLGTIGLSGGSGNYYPNNSARKLQRMWTKLLAYEQSGGKYVAQWRSTFNHSDYSFIQQALGGSNKVYSKPGWMWSSSWSGGTIWDDSAIVRNRDGRTYLLTMLTQTTPGSNTARDIVRAIDRIQKELPNS